MQLLKFLKKVKEIFEFDIFYIIYKAVYVIKLNFEEIIILLKSLIVYV